MANLYLIYDGRKPRLDGSGTIKIALTHKHKTAYRSLDIHVLPEQWDAKSAQVIGRPDRKFINVELRKMFANCTVGLERVERRSDFDQLTEREIIDMVMRGADTADHLEDLDYVLPVYNEYITLCRKVNTIQSYRTSLNNLIEYCKDIDSLRFKDINGAWLRKYQNWLLDARGMAVNGANVYLRNLRTVFNYARQNELTLARYPFRDIDMTTTEPDKCEVPYDKFIEWATIPMPDRREMYRDLFILSIYLCGIRPVDMLHVKKSQVENGRLVYHPMKLNGRTKLSIKIEPEAWELIKKYEGEDYLLNMMESRTDYRTFAKYWNAAIRAIGEDQIIHKVGRNGKNYCVVKHKGILPLLKVKDARSCFGTFLYNILDIPIDIISQAMGHSNGLRVTNFYVKRDLKKIDEANRMLIDKIKADMQAQIAHKG